jgi:hypothetical protein
VLVTARRNCSAQLINALPDITIAAHIEFARTDATNTSKPAAGILVGSASPRQLTQSAQWPVCLRLCARAHAHTHARTHARRLRCDRPAQTSPCVAVQMSANIHGFYPTVVLRATKHEECGRPGRAACRAVYLGRRVMLQHRRAVLQRGAAAAATR